jgi:hypothetical protein
MTPRIITADEARVLREAATPGPWRVTDYDTVAPSIGCGGWDIAVVHGDDDGRPWDADDSEPVAPLPLSDAALIAAAPDLAATVEALHAEVARLRASMQRISGVVAAVAGVLDYAHETATREDIDFDDMVVSKLVFAIEPYSHGGWKKKAEALRAMLAEVAT